MQNLFPCYREQEMKLRLLFITMIVSMGLFLVIYFDMISMMIMILGSIAIIVGILAGAYSFHVMKCIEVEKKKV